MANVVTSVDRTKFYSVVPHNTGGKHNIEYDAIFRIFFLVVTCSSESEFFIYNGIGPSHEFLPRTERENYGVLRNVCRQCRKIENKNFKNKI